MLFGLNDSAYRKCPVLHVTDPVWKQAMHPLTAPLPSGEQNGTLKIIDRKKHIFKLAQGEYIAPEKIENIYLRSKPVAQVFVYGESLQVGAFWAVSSDVQVWWAPNSLGALNVMESLQWVSDMNWLSRPTC